MMSSGRSLLRRFAELVVWLWFSRNRLPILNFPIPWRLPNGCWFLIYPDEMGLNLAPLPWKSYSYEEGEWRFLCKLIRPGMVCFDIGANQGFYTVFLSRCVSAQGQVFAFEPVSTEFRKLKLNAGINRCNNVVMENIAMGDQEGFIDMFVCLDGHGSRSSLCRPPQEVKARTTVEQVPITTLDCYVTENHITRIDFIKIDVEGAEMAVLKGGRKVLTTMRPLIMIEMADVATKCFGYNAIENYRFLEANKYLLFEVTPKGSLQPARAKDTWRENLIAVPSEKLEYISESYGRAKW